MDPIFQNDVTENKDDRTGIVTTTPTPRDVTEDAVLLDLHTKIRAAIAGNEAALAALPAAVANVQGVIDGTAANITQANAMIDTLATALQSVLTQNGRMMRQITALERLVVGSDLLRGNEGT